MEVPELTATQSCWGRQRVVTSDIIQQLQYARLHRKTYILVVAVGTRYGNVRTVADIETIRVRRASRITVRVVNRRVGDGQAGGAVNAVDLHRCVLDVEVGDRGRPKKIVGIKEGGLGLATVGAFAVPPAAAVTIEICATGTSHGNVGAGHRHERAGPFFVTERRLAFEDHLWCRQCCARHKEIGLVAYVSATLKAGQVKGDTRGHCHCRENNSRTGCL